MPRKELKILLILASVQFLVFLDFELMMPLGPYIGPSLGVDATQLGELVSAYMLGSMLAGYLYSRVADRYEKRASLDLFMAGLALSTLLCGLGQSYLHLMAARVLAGAMAGPAGSVIFSIVSDVVPEERRGKGIGIVMGGFTLASVIGLPLSVHLAGALGWRLPFILLAAVAAVVLLLARLNLPQLKGHAPEPALGRADLAPLLQQRAALLAWACVAVLMVGDFAFVPFMPLFLTNNLGIGREHLGFVYGCAGLTTLVTFQGSGRLTDRFGTLPVYAVFSVLACGVLYGIFVGLPQPSSLALATAAMMALFFTNAPRILSAFTLFTKAPLPGQRGEFLALQNVVQNGAVGLGSLFAAHAISGAPGAPLTGTLHLALQAWAAIALGLVLIWLLERAIKDRPA